MSSRLEDTATLVLEKYDGDLEKLREAANKDPEEIRKLVKEFKVNSISHRVLSDLTLCPIIFCLLCQGKTYTKAYLLEYNGNQPGNPLKGVEVIVDVVKGEGSAKGKEFPLFVGLGSDFYTVARQETVKTLDNLEAWKDVSFSTDFKD